ncbi:hypothetical protein IAU60_006532 [Kwoniella sp. DSM 27419]
MALRHAALHLAPACSSLVLPRHLIASTSYSTARSTTSFRSYRLVPLRTYASSSSKPKQDIGIDDRSESIWNLPPPPGEPVASGSTGERGLPVPDNTGLTSTNAAGRVDGEDLLQAGDTTETSSTSPRSPPGEAAEPMPNYPTLPSADIPSSSTLPKLGEPNARLFKEERRAGESTHRANNPPFDFSALSSRFADASKHLTIPPEVQARIAAWASNVLGHSKRVAKDAERRLVELGLKVNQVTGYEEVERLKGLVFAKEDNLQSLREAARSAKTSYDEAVASRSAAQRDVNSLLERKHSWTDSDVSRFTSLVRADHASTHAVATTSVQLKEAELAVDKAFSELMQTILQRYHEEQVWSDKIRSVSTWANLIGLALNAVIFLGAVIIVEPWKRRRLVERLEERIAGMMERVEGRLQGMEGHLGDLAPALALATSTGASPVDIPPPSLREQETPSDMAEPAQMPVEPSVPDSNTPSHPINDAKELEHQFDLAQVISAADIPLRPLITTKIEHLPPYLDVVANPSQERDMAVAGLAGAGTMACVMVLGRWLFS